MKSESGLSLAIARRPFGNNSGTTFGANLWQPCDNFMTTFQSHWDNFGKASRQLFDSFETSLRQLWIIIGTTLRQLEENFETTLGLWWPRSDFWRSATLSHGQHMAIFTLHMCGKSVTFKTVAFFSSWRTKICPGKNLTYQGQENCKGKKESSWKEVRASKSYL